MSNSWTTINLTLMDRAILEEIGLSRAEIQLYLKLLKLGSVPSSRVVHETGFRRSTVYDGIRRLQEKGLVSHVIKNSRKYFEAANPERIIDFLHEKKRMLDQQTEEVRRILPDLKKDYSTLKPHAEAHVLMGVEGFKTMRRDVLRNAGREHLILGSIGREHEVMPVFFNNWNESREIKRIHLKMLYKETFRRLAMASKKVFEKYYEIRFLPEEFQGPSVINIYGDRVVNVIWKGGEPICFMLINKDIADAYRQYFNYLWGRAKK
ncbi:MAG: hypothetical protein FJY77_00515 [Candidatus Altiarchaeales archaeon]|nr:hypothetical protein [Candidatus Altiarchaeales archaeon]